MYTGPMHWIAIGLVLIGGFFWLWTIRSFFENPGYGSFDMTTASAFDLGWLKGALLVGIGAGLLAHSVGIGAVVGIAGFFSSVPLKPVLEKAMARRTKRMSSPSEDDAPPSGFAALDQVERDATKDSEGDIPDHEPG